jgi:hypothetical protein
VLAGGASAAATRDVRLFRTYQQTDSFAG